MGVWKSFHYTHIHIHTIGIRECRLIILLGEEMRKGNTTARALFLSIQFTVTHQPPTIFIILLAYVSICYGGRTRENQFMGIVFLLLIIRCCMYGQVLSRRLLGSLLRTRYNHTWGSFNAVHRSIGMPVCLQLQSDCRGCGWMMGEWRTRSPAVPHSVTLTDKPTLRIHENVM